MQTKFTEIANKITTIKSGFAEAISAKGVETAPNAPFSTMIENIGNIASGNEQEPEPPSIPEVEEWVKPHDWIDIETEPLEAGEIRVLMCDLFGKENNSIYFARRSGTTTIKATIDWGDGTQEEVNVDSANTTVSHTFVREGVWCDRGYNQYVVRIKFNEPKSAPKHIWFYRQGSTSLVPIYNNLLWIYGDMQYSTTLSHFTRYNGLGCDAVLLERFSCINTSHIYDMTSLFNGCSSLKSIEGLDTSGVNIMGSMFQNCRSLKTIPQLDTSKVTNMSSMFTNCYSLKEVPELNSSEVTNMGSMFLGCCSLIRLPNLDTSKVTNMTNMFNGCSLLERAPQINTINVTTMVNMFGYCYSLIEIPSLDTSNATNVSSIFSGCSSLKKSPPLDTRKTTVHSSNNNHFGSCGSLVEVGTIILSKDIILSIGKSPLIKIDLAYDETDAPVFTQTVPIKINYTQLSAESLNKLMSQLPDGNGKTLDLKYNRGSLDCDPSIATAKNWTVLVK